MAEVTLSDTVAAPVAEVWAVVGDYGGISAWHPAIAASQVMDGPAGDQVGAIRQCELDGGAMLLERLTARSEAEHFYSYVITDAPMPMTNYQGTIRLTPAAEAGQTVIEWSSTFDPAPGAEAELTQMIAGVYQAGFDALKARF